METKTLEKVASAAQTIKKPVIVEKRYKLVVNGREKEYHPLPPKLRKEDSNPVRLSSHFINGGTGILRGLNTIQEHQFISKLINKNPRDMGFDEAVTNYWAEYTVTVPVNKGLELDASYKVVTVNINGEQVEIEEPVNLKQYIQANFAMNNIRCAFYPEERANPALYDVIMTNLSEAKEAEYKSFSLQVKVMEKFAELAKGASEGSINEKIGYLLDILQEPTQNFFSLKPQDKLLELNKIAMDKQAQFLSAIDDKELAEKSLLFRLTQTRVITVEGDTYFYEDTNLGTKREALGFLQDQTKSGIVSKMKARLQDILK